MLQSPAPAPAASHHRAAYLSLAASMTLVGCYVALSKPLVAALPVALLGTLRFAIGALAVPHWLRSPPGQAALGARLHALLFLQALLGNFLFTLCMLHGVRLAGSSSAGVMLALIPAAVALLARVFLGERISPRVAAAIALSVLGVAGFTLSKQELLTQAGRALQPDFAANFWGHLLLLGAVFCEASYAVIGRRVGAHCSPRRVTAIINLWGLALMAPLGWLSARDFDWSAPTVQLWALLVFYALSASVGSVWLWMNGLRLAPANVAGVFTVFLPLGATATSVLALGERLGALQALALALALAGVVLATRTPPATGGPSGAALNTRRGP